MSKKVYPYKNCKIMEVCNYLNYTYFTAILVLTMIIGKSNIS